MWTLRFLSGPMAGQTVPLNKSSTLIGRARNCDVKIASANVSKEHTRIEIFDDKVIVSDVGSRNGTFLNGVKIRSSKAKSGDRIAMHDIFFEIVDSPQLRPGPQHGNYFPPPTAYGNAAYQMQPGPSPEPESEARVDFFRQRWPQMTEAAQTYLETVVLPGLYRLPQIFEFRWVLAGLMALFILLVTTLSTIPLIRILKSSIEEESQHHAMTIATTLARVNIPALSQGLDSAVSVDIATTRPGVKKAFVISSLDGNVIAPASQAGTYPQLPYVHDGRKLDRETTKQVDDSTVIAMVPVRFYNSETGSQAITAWAVVFYDMGALAVDNSQVLSLFITTLFISLILGFGLFFGLYKLIENPIRSLNTQLDVALKEGHETITLDYRFPALQTLVSNISSALSRAINGNEGNNANRGLEHDRNREIANLIELIGFAAMGIRASDLTVAAVNQACEARLGQTAAQLASINVNQINDQALKLSIKDLIERVDKNPDEMASNELEFSGLNFQLVAQSIFGTNQIAYYLIVMLPVEAEG